MPPFSAALAGRAREEFVGMDSPLDRIKFMWSWMTERAPVYFDSVLRDHIKPVAAYVSKTDPNVGHTTYALTVPRSLCNAGGNLHGGAVALIFDICTSTTVSVVAREGFWDTGHVSRTLNCTYLRPAPEGSELLVECETVHLGKSLAHLKGVIRRKSDGAVCYTCEHGKAKVDFRLQGQEGGPKL
jgi:uncharacterized protein (TIGR00369 family)